MPGEGWRLAKEEAGLQVWVRVDPARHPIARLHFRPDHFTIEVLLFYDDLPLHPAGATGACSKPRCQTVSGLSLDEVIDWFAEYLGYLGWRDGPYLFRKDRESDAGHDLLQLTYEEVEGGIVVVVGAHGLPAAGLAIPSHARTAHTHAAKGFALRLAACGGPLGRRFGLTFPRRRLNHLHQQPPVVAGEGVGGSRVMRAHR